MHGGIDIMPTGGTYDTPHSGIVPDGTFASQQSAPAYPGSTQE